MNEQPRGRLESLFSVVCDSFALFILPTVFNGIYWTMMYGLKEREICFLDVHTFSVLKKVYTFLIYVEGLGFPSVILGEFSGIGHFGCNEGTGA